MFEMALISSKKINLETYAQKGDKDAKDALLLLDAPSNFFSTVQIVITLSGILTGLYSGEHLKLKITYVIQHIWVVSAQAEVISSFIVVISITFFTLVFGELIPKRIAVAYPETIARNMGSTMRTISKICYPFVFLLASSTELILKVFNLKKQTNINIAEDEIKAILREGAKAGEIKEIEQNIVDRVFNLGDRTIASIMTPKNNMCFIELTDNQDEIHLKVKENPHSIYPVFDQNRDHIKGVIYLKDLYLNIAKNTLQLSEIIHSANFILVNTSVYEALEKFKLTNINYGIAIDEFGQTQGIVTLHDILDGLLGGIYETNKKGLQIEVRQDGSFLIDGYYPWEDFLNYFDLNNFSGKYPFNTLSGLVFNELKHIPKTGEKLYWQNMEIEIVDMDGVKIDKVIVKIISKQKVEQIKPL
jgi:putative hemolysin